MLQSQHSPRVLSSEDILGVTNRIDMNEFNTVLDPILVERGVGTENHEVVKNVSTYLCTLVSVEFRTRGRSHYHIYLFQGDNEANDQI